MNIEEKNNLFKSYIKETDFLIDRIEKCIKCTINENQCYSLKKYIDLSNRYIKRKYQEFYDINIQSIFLQLEAQIEVESTKLKFPMYF